MYIKRKKKEKRIQLLGGLIGICVAVVSLFYFFHAEKAEAEKRMVEIVNYVKVQCSTYTHYNESSESKSLLRAIESARQMSTNIKMETENGGQLSEDFLRENYERCVRIPMRGGLRSLNLSNSVAVAVYEVFRQRGFSGLEAESNYLE